MRNKVAINGLGRIGRAALKLAVEQPELELVAVNEIGSLENMVYLRKYDTAYGRYERQVEAPVDPVLEGTKLWAAARPRRRSLAPPGLSTSAWVAV